LQLNQCFYDCVLAHLFGNTAKEPFRSSSQAATNYYQSNHSKAEGSREVPCPRTQQANLPA